MVYMRLGTFDFTIDKGEIKSDNTKAEEFLTQAKSFFVHQNQHQDDPDMLLADYFINVLGAELTKYDMPEALRQAYQNGVIL